MLILLRIRVLCSDDRQPKWTETQQRSHSTHPPIKSIASPSDMTSASDEPSVFLLRPPRLRRRSRASWRSAAGFSVECRAESSIVSRERLELIRRWKARTLALWKGKATSGQYTRTGRRIRSGQKDSLSQMSRLSLSNSSSSDSSTSMSSDPGSSTRSSSSTCAL